MSFNCFIDLHSLLIQDINQTTFHFIKGSVIMGLGPSTKMTTLYHANCPITKELYGRKDVEIPGVIIAGVSENYLEKVFTAKRVGNLVDSMKADGVIVALDGWGNHHIDFVSIIEEVGKRGIPSVGMSFFGLQGRLVFTSDYLDTLIDFNKGTTGYESCIVGENHLSALDAYKAVTILIRKIEKKCGSYLRSCECLNKSKLTQKRFFIDSVEWGKKTSFTDNKLILSNELPDISGFQEWIEKVTVSIIKPNDHDRFVNSNLDFFPIACKSEGAIGEGVTHILDGVIAMITGVEQGSHFQPSNIGSSEGILAEQVIMNTPGTPRETDYLIGIDLLFKEGAGRTKEGIQAAHEIADRVIDPIRKELKEVKRDAEKTVIYQAKPKENQKRIVLVKVVSGLGNMYETVLFPREPAGFIDAYSTMEFSNLPVVVSTNQLLDGVIHSLL